MINVQACASFVQSNAGRLGELCGACPKPNLHYKTCNPLNVGPAACQIICK